MRVAQDSDDQPLRIAPLSANEASGGEALRTPVAWCMTCEPPPRPALVNSHLVLLTQRGYTQSIPEHPSKPLQMTRATRITLTGISGLR